MAQKIYMNLREREGALLRELPLKCLDPTNKYCGVIKIIPQ